MMLLGVRLPVVMIGYRLCLLAPLLATDYMMAVITARAISLTCTTLAPLLLSVKTKSWEVATDAMQCIAATAAALFRASG